jgi:hypothetical protein
MRMRYAVVCRRLIQIVNFFFILMFLCICVSYFNGEFSSEITCFNTVGRFRQVLITFVLFSKITL